MPSIRSTFIFEQAPFSAAHASTIAETPAGLVAAWFGGTREGHRDVGIWVARHDGHDWLPPVEVANGHVTLRRSYPCWNPVLFQPPQGAAAAVLQGRAQSQPLVGHGATSSSDGGRTWSEPRRLPDGILGPIKNKPLALPGGQVAVPVVGREGRWRIHLEWSDDQGASWQRGPALNDGRRFAAIQPALLTWASGRLQLLCRTRQGAIGTCWSEDGGDHLDGPGRDRSAQPGQRHRRRHSGGRPGLARLQPQPAGAHAAQRRHQRRRRDLVGCRRSGGRSRASSPIPPSSRGATARSTSPTPGTAVASATRSGARSDVPAGTPVGSLRQRRSRRR